MGGWNVTAAHGQLEIDSFELNGKNRRVLNLQTLFSAANVRGSDLIIPGVAGVKPRRRRVTATEHSLSCILRGDVDDTGAITADPLAALADLCDLYVALADPPTVGDGTKSSTLTFPNGATSTKDIHVLGFEVGDMVGPWSVRAVLDISIPSGRY